MTGLLSAFLWLQGAHSRHAAAKWKGLADQCAELRKGDRRHFEAAAKQAPITASSSQPDLDASAAPMRSRSSGASMRKVYRISSMAEPATSVILAYAGSQDFGRTTLGPRACEGDEFDGHRVRERDESNQSERCRVLLTRCA